jgi:hypothetical protein
MRCRVFIPLWIISLALAGMANAAERQAPPAPNETDEIRIVPVPPTPEPETVETRVVFPQMRDIQTKNPVDVQIRLDGYPLRTYSQFPRAREVLNYNKEGQSLHIVVDNEPYFAENEAIVDALDNAMDYYDQVLEFEVPFDLSPGMHILRVFPARSYGESIKSDGAFTARTFFFRTKTPTINVDLSQPYLTANQPQGDYKYDSKKPILLDFYLTNVLLSRDGYKVRVTIDKTVQRIVTQWIPYYIYGLKQGDHTIKLELLNEQNKVAPGEFNSVERSFTLK